MSSLTWQEVSLEWKVHGTPAPCLPSTDPREWKIRGQPGGARRFQTCGPRTFPVEQKLG